MSKPPWFAVLGRGALARLVLAPGVLRCQPGPQPGAWNRRFYLSGNGGYAGESLDAPQRVRARLQVVRRGFATAATNTGHDCSASFTCKLPSTASAKP